MAAEFDHQPLPRLILHGVERHFEAVARGIKLVGGQVGVSQNVAVNGHGLRQPIGDGGTGKAQVLDADRFAALQAEVVEGGGQLAAVQGAGAAENQVAEDGGGAVATFRIVHAAGGDQERERGRTDVAHRLDDQRQAVVERMNRGRRGHGAGTRV